MGIAKTIQIFLPDGNPVGVKKIDVTSRTIKGIYVPRAMFPEVCVNIEELKQPGIYFLFGGEENDECYIGESENCFERLRHHNRNKDFWDKAVIFVSKVSDGFTKSHIKYLEHFMINLAVEVKRYNIVNSNSTNEPVVSESTKADIDDYFEIIKLLLSTLGFRVFGINQKKSNKETLFCKCKEALAKGEYTEEGFIVYKGSTTRKNILRAAHNFIPKQREILINKGILKLNEDQLLYIFKEDHIFSSPSTAAGIINGGNINGWTAWKNKQGKTLDELKRK